VVDRRLVEQLQASRRILVVSGAGVSTRERHSRFPRPRWGVDAPASRVLRRVPGVGSGSG
jgi:hypothetical protein